MLMQVCTYVTFLGLKFWYPKMQVMNMHVAIQAADDIKINTTFSHISAFHFENYLGELTRLVRTANRPLSQICRRLHELSKINIQKINIKRLF